MRLQKIYLLGFACISLSCVFGLETQKSNGTININKSSKLSNKILNGKELTSFYSPNSVLFNIRNSSNPSNTRYISYVVFDNDGNIGSETGAGLTDASYFTTGTLKSGSSEFQGYFFMLTSSSTGSFDKVVSVPLLPKNNTPDFDSEIVDSNLITNAGFDPSSDPNLVGMAARGNMAYFVINKIVTDHQQSQKLNCLYQANIVEENNLYPQFSILPETTCISSNDGEQVQMEVSQSGNYLFVLSKNSQNLYAFNLSKTGILDFNSSIKYQIPNPAVTLQATNKFVQLFSDLGTDTPYSYLLVNSPGNFIKYLKVYASGGVINFELLKTIEDPTDKNKISGNYNLSYDGGNSILVTHVNSSDEAELNHYYLDGTPEFVETDNAIRGPQKNPWDGSTNWYTGSNEQHLLSTTPVLRTGNSLNLARFYFNEAVTNELQPKHPSFRIRSCLFNKNECKVVDTINVRTNLRPSQSVFYQQLLIKQFN